MKTKFNLRTVNVTRYISPLREGGSLPALAEADDLNTSSNSKAPVMVKSLNRRIEEEIARVLKLQIPVGVCKSR
jgi:hypothetical protein